jgi:hypothetical protein
VNKLEPKSPTKEQVRTLTASEIESLRQEMKQASAEIRQMIARDKANRM